MKIQVKVTPKPQANSKPKPQVKILALSKPKPTVRPLVERASNNYNFTSPIVKWVGGKSQSLDQIKHRLPDKINTYMEPFVGGGSVLLMILELVERGELTVQNYVVSDNNALLINMYWCIQFKSQEVIQQLQVLKEEYLSITTLNVGDKLQRSNNTLEEAKATRESYYYWQRDRYNELSKTFKKQKQHDATTCKPELAALMIFLNKTCFRGLYREGPNGFNVPYGNYKNPQIYNTKHIERLSQLLAPVTFSIEDFQVVIIRAEPGDFVYMDPPYVPEKQTSFTAYIKDGFKQYQELFDLCSDLNNENINFLLSNSNTPLVTDYFTTDIFNVDKIDCRRAINSKNPEARAREVFITNKD